MIKRDSKRRWIARARLGHWIAEEVIENHGLGRPRFRWEAHRYCAQARLKDG